MTEGEFAAWLASNVANSAMPMVALRDSWGAVGCRARAKRRVSPGYPPAAQWGAAGGGAGAMARSLRRTERQPLASFTKPQWQLLFDGQPQPWVVATDLPFSWREDGNALAMYAYSVAQGNRQQRVALAVWSRSAAGKKWAEQQPPDRKPWELSPAPEEPGQPAFRWMKDRFLQRVRIDIPVLQRFRHGSHIEYHTDEVLVPAGHQRMDGWSCAPPPSPVCCGSGNCSARPVAGPQRAGGRQVTDLDAGAARQRHLGRAGRLPVALGEVVIPGLWRGAGARHGAAHLGGAVALPAKPWPGRARGGGPSLYLGWQGTAAPGFALACGPHHPHTPCARAQIAAGACVGHGWGDKESDADLRKPTWRWYQEPFTWERLEKTEYTPLYEVRDIVPDNQGVWRLLPSWRTIAATQHPCADGDYFWAGDVKDELWWFGGMRQIHP